MKNKVGVTYHLWWKKPPSSLVVSSSGQLTSRTTLHTFAGLIEALFCFVPAFMPYVPLRVSWGWRGTKRTVTVVNGCKHLRWPWNIMGVCLKPTGVTESSWAGDVRARGTSSQRDGSLGYFEAWWILHCLMHLSCIVSSMCQLITQNGSRIFVMGCSFTSKITCLVLSQMGWKWLQGLHHQRHLLELQNHQHHKVLQLHRTIPVTNP